MVGLTLGGTKYSVSGKPIDALPGINLPSSQGSGGAANNVNIKPAASSQLSGISGLGGKLPQIGSLRLNKSSNGSPANVTPAAIQNNSTLPGAGKSLGATNAVIYDNANKVNGTISEKGEVASKLNTLAGILPASAVNPALRQNAPAGSLSLSNIVIGGIALAGLLLLIFIGGKKIKA